MFKEKYQKGKSFRKNAPRSSHDVWKPASGRPSVESMIIQSNEDRIPELFVSPGFSLQNLQIKNLFCETRRL